MAWLGTVLTKEKKAAEASAGCVLVPAKSVPARKNILDSGEGKERSQQEGREESKTPLQNFVLTLQEQGAGTPVNRAEHE